MSPEITEGKIQGLYNESKSYTFSMDKTFMKGITNIITYKPKRNKTNNLLKNP